LVAERQRTPLCNIQRILTGGVQCHMAIETSGWYARLDQECPDRARQIEVWLDSWELAIVQGQPIAATLPAFWPTLPAGLLSNPGSVLDNLLARHEAESDGRSPRGVYAAPPSFADAILYDELGQGRSLAKEPPATISLMALPPSFRTLARQLNDGIGTDGALDTGDPQDESSTKTGVPLPFSDPCVGAGLLVERILRIHNERLVDLEESERKQDCLRLLEGLQLVDSSDIAVETARRRILIVLGKLGIVDLVGDGDECTIGRSEAVTILDSNVRCFDVLRDEWPWVDKPMLTVSKPPWLRIKDRFRGHPDGSKLRKELSRELREFRSPSGEIRFSAIRGNVNLYRLFIERSLQLTEPGGRVRLIVPESVLREKSSAPIRKLLVTSNEWDSVWSFPEGSEFLFGGVQGVSVLGVVVGGETEVLTSFGPLRNSDLVEKRGVGKEAPFIELERGPWSIWTDTSWAVPKMPRDCQRRNETMKAIGSLADKPRLSEAGAWIDPGGKSIRVRTGEVDQKSHSSKISDWRDVCGDCPLIRASHVKFVDGSVSLNHPFFNHDGLTTSGKKDARFIGDSNFSGSPRIACKAMTGPNMERRLAWFMIPAGCALDSSFSFLELPSQILERLVDDFGNIEAGLSSLVKYLNSRDLNLWSTAWSANNNVNNYEIETLPFAPIVAND